jgi:hypothetical protein
MFATRIGICFQTVLPFGIFTGAMIAPSTAVSAEVAHFSLSFWAYSLLPLALIEARVFFPRLHQFQNVEVRSRMFGVVLVPTGISVQLIAAVHDLNS